MSVSEAVTCVTTSSKSTPKTTTVTKPRLKTNKTMKQMTSSMMKQTTTSTASTQTSPADIQLSSLKNEDLSVWASAYAPPLWVPTHDWAELDGGGGRVGSEEECVDETENPIETTFGCEGRGGSEEKSTDETENPKKTTFGCKGRCGLQEKPTDVTENPLKMTFGCEGRGGSEGECADEMGNPRKKTFGFVHVAPKKFDSSWSCDRQVRFWEKEGCCHSSEPAVAEFRFESRSFVDSEKTDPNIGEKTERLNTRVKLRAEKKGLQLENSSRTEEVEEVVEKGSPRHESSSRREEEEEDVWNRLSREASPSSSQRWTSLLDVINVLKRIEKCVATTDAIDSAEIKEDDVARTGHLGDASNASSELAVARTGHLEDASNASLESEVAKDCEGKMEDAGKKEVNEEKVAKDEVEEKDEIDEEASQVAMANKSVAGTEKETKSVACESDDPMDVEPDSHSISKEELEANLILKEELERRLEAEKTCATCGRKFATKKSRIRHEVSHSTVRPFACEYCGKTFKLKQAVYEHQRNLHPFQYLATKETHEPRAKKLRRLDKIESHPSDSKKKEESAENHREDDDDDENRCDDFPVAVRASRLIACHLCDETLSDKKDYEDHVILAHGGDGGGHVGGANAVKEEAYFKKCPICSKSCKTPGLMKLHMRDAHSDPFARFECEFCGQKFKKKTLLTQHIAYRHKERSVSCPHCDKVYATVYDLKRHAVHHDESLKPRCGVCQRVFTTKLNLKKHVEKYHESSAAKAAATVHAAAAAAVALGVRKSRAPVAGQNPNRGNKSGLHRGRNKTDQRIEAAQCEANKESDGSSVRPEISTANATDSAASGPTTPRLVEQPTENQGATRLNFDVHDDDHGAVTSSESVPILQCTNALSVSAAPTFAISRATMSRLVHGAPTMPATAPLAPTVPGSASLTSTVPESAALTSTVPGLAALTSTVSGSVLGTIPASFLSSSASPSSVVITSTSSATSPVLSTPKSAVSSFAAPANYVFASPKSVVSGNSTWTGLSPKTILRNLAPAPPSGGVSSMISSMPSIIAARPSIICAKSLPISTTPSLTEVSTGINVASRAEPPQLATLELVPATGSDDGASLTLALQPLSTSPQRVSRSMPMMQSRNGKILQLSTLIQQPSQPPLHHSFATSQLQFASTSEGPALVFTATASPVITADGTFQQLATNDQLPIGHVITAISLPTESIEDNPGRY